MKNIKRVFGDSIVELCKTLAPEKVKMLDFILTQEREFPHFKITYSLRLAEKMIYD